MMNRPKTIASLNKRERARYLAACARYQAEKQKPPTRSQAQAWLAPIRKAFNEMRTGVLIEYHEVDACFVTLNACEDLLLTFKRATLIDAANTESINIELELLGLKEAA